MADRSTRATLFALVLVAFNLRWPITSIPTVLADIREATGAGEVAMGALTTLPILCMGLLAFLAPRLAARFGAARTVWGGLALLIVAPVLRLLADQPLPLVLSTLLAGIGIAIVGGLVPGIVKEQLPGSIGLVTGIWTAVMSAGASLGAALTVPMGGWFGSWKLGLAMWVVPAVVAWLVWGAVERPHRTPAQQRATSTLRDLPWRSPIAWAVTVFIAVNSFGFYSGVAWLAESLQQHGMSQEQSGYVLGLFTAAGIVAAFVFPPLLQRTRHRAALIGSLVTLTMLSLFGLAFFPTTGTVIWAMGFGGFNTGWFAIGLGMLAWLSDDGAAAGRLTAMVYTLMYLFASIGPIFCGWLLHATGSWALLYGLLGVICIPPLFVTPMLVRHMHERH